MFGIQKIMRYLFLTTLFGTMLIVSSVLAEAVETFTFEDSYEKWQERGDGVKIEITNEFFYEGKVSLRVSGRTQGWHGVQIELKDLLIPQETYKFEGWVFHNSGREEKIIITMQRRYSGESTGWDRIAEIVVPSGQWVKIEGEYTVKSKADELTFYFESENPTLSFYVDKVQIFGKPKELKSALSIEIRENFESKLRNLTTFGKANIHISDELSYEGKYSLKIAKSVSPWDGFKLDLSEYLENLNNIQAEISAQFYHNSESPQRAVILLSYSDGSKEYYEYVADTILMPNKWVKVSGNILFDLGFKMKELALIFCLPNGTDFEFYVDDIALSTTDVSKKYGVLKSFDFEEGISGWQPRGDGVNVNTTTDVARSGKKSLMIINRSQNWQGAQFDVRNILEPGKTYFIDAWVYQETGNDQTVVMTMQRKYSTDGNTNYDWIKPETIPSGKWTKVSGTYSVRSNVNVEELILYFESTTSPNMVFYIDDITIYKEGETKIGPDLSTPSLKDVYSEYFKIGVALPAKALANPSDVELAKRHFNSITAENEMKPESILVTPGVYSFEQADLYVKFAQDNRMVIRGHTLIWHSQTPDWFFRDENGNLLTREALIDRMRDYIHTVVGHFKGKIYAWDVVNEAIEPSEPDGYRKSLWYQIIGPEYIELAFNFAHEADPDAKLFYNDYNEYLVRKRELIYNLVKNLKAKGVPIHGIGMQQHINVRTDLNAIEETLSLFSSIDGIEIHITELDVSIAETLSLNYREPTKELLLEQAEFYNELFEIYKLYSDVITNVTLWGLKDDYSWKNQQRNDWPLLFDKNYQAKYSYWALVDKKVLPVKTKSVNISQGEAIVLGGLDGSYLNSQPITISVDNRVKLIGYAIYSGETLYVYAEITDRTDDFDTDRVSIFIDPKELRVPYIHNDVIIITLWRNGKVDVNKKDLSFEHFVEERYGKYSVEIGVTIPGLRISRDQNVGFDILVVDGQQRLSWSDTKNNQDFSTMDYGKLAVDTARTATAKYGTPIIDGEYDDIWNTAEEFVTDVVAAGGENNAYAKIRALWDSEYLYLFVTVYDTLLNSNNPNPWEQDSVEIFIDENNKKTASYQDDDSQFRVNYKNEQSFAGAATPDRFKTVTRLFEGGYVVEMAIKWKTITPSEGTVIGFDFQVNDADSSGSRVGMMKWSDPTNNTWQDLSRIGNLILSK